MKFAIIGLGKIGTAIARLRAFGNQSRNLQYSWAEDPRGLGANDFRCLRSALCFQVIQAALTAFLISAHHRFWEKAQIDS